MPTRKQDGVREATVRRRPASAAPGPASRNPDRGTGGHPGVEGPHVDDEADPDTDDVLLDDQLTAQPLYFEFDATSPVPETGLSVDPEDLGRQALVDATQQDNFESLHENGDVGMHVINPHLSELPD
jgi:hypothetical protein